MERVTEAEAAARLRNFALFYRDGAAPYEERGTAALLLAIMALDYRRAKPPRHVQGDNWLCPSCRCLHGRRAPFCDCCGQRIDWAAVREKGEK